LSTLSLLQERVKHALKGGRKQEVRALRVLVSEIQLAAKDSGHELDTEQEWAVLRKERKRRLESIEAFRAGGREDLVAAEEYTAGLIEELLPKQLDPDELAALVDRIIAETGVSTPRDMGAVMNAVMREAGGLVDGKSASRIVKERLSG